MATYAHQTLADPVAPSMNNLTKPVTEWARLHGVRYQALLAQTYRTGNLPEALKRAIFLEQRFKRRRARGSVDKPRVVAYDLVRPRACIERALEFLREEHAAEGQKSRRRRILWALLKAIGPSGKKSCDS